MNIVAKKNLYFAISLLVIIPGFISLCLFGLNLSIDFTGGSRLTFVAGQKFTPQKYNQLQAIFSQAKEKIVTLQTAGQSIIIRVAPISAAKNQQLVASLQSLSLKEEEFETVGPTIGSETTANAVKGILIASILIIMYIAWSFRQVPKPVSSLRFGVCAIFALLHDVLVVLGIFSLLGHFWGVEVDSLFVTALLTIIGFSVHDTIVVFDRIRENLKRTGAADFAKVVNESILQTLGRSLNTSLTVILVLLTLLFFGGESTRWFIAALMIGVISGTYSSIFNASLLLVVWEKWSRNRTK